MAVYTEANHISRVAGADLSTKQYYIVKLSGANVVLASAAADKILGVLANAPASGDVADVSVRSGSGTFKVVAGGSISIGDYLTSDGSGKAVATTTAGQEVFGIAVAAASANEVVEYMKANSRY